MRTIRKLVFIACTAASALLLCSFSPAKVKPTKNVIVMVPDGTSTSVLALTRWYKMLMGEERALATDEILCGMVSSYMSDAPIAGSAGAMSIFMTGIPAQQQNISVYPAANPGQDLVEVDPTRTWNPAMTVMEAARVEKGKALGIVVKSSYCHATPAAATSHAESRSEYAALSEQMASLGLDVCFSGGRKNLTDATKAILADNGTTLLVNDLEGFNSYSGDAPLWSIFNYTQMEYEIDRDPEAEPSLAQMTSKALDMLSRRKNGFFLMVEGSNVDFAAHANDIPAVLSEYWCFDDAVRVALDFAKKDGNTTVVVLPDHGNSGINFGKAGYYGYSINPIGETLKNIDKFKSSTYRLSLRVMAEKEPEKIAALFKQWMDIELTEDEMAAVMRFIDKDVKDYMRVEGTLQSLVSNIVASRTNIGFVSGNHTGEDIFLGVYAPKGAKLEGIHTNVELNHYLRQVTGLKMDLESLSDLYFADAQDLFSGMQLSEELRDGVHVLTVKNGVKTMEVFGNRSYVVMNGIRKSLCLPVVYMTKNSKFYVPQDLRKMMQ